MKHFFWVDLEMTGLDDVKDVILEVAAVITDTDLKPIEEFHRVVQQPQAALDGMDDWCKRTHGASGLTAAVPGGTPLAEVETELLTFVNKYFPATERVILVGNSIGNDKRFIDRYMLNLAARLHYRVIDVSSFKEVFKEKWGVQVNKKNAHRAVDDIHESIKELETYLSYVKVPDATTKA